MNKTSTLTIVALIATGCAARTHITPTHGQASAAVFSRQRPATAKVTAPVSGLDSQEANVVSESYLRGMAPKGATSKEEPMLIVAPPTQSGYDRTKLAPSVPPKER